MACVQGNVDGRYMVGVAPFLLLDVDGVMHPLRESGHPLHASIEDLIKRADDDIALQSDSPESVSHVVDGEFTDDCMDALAECVRACGAQIVLSSTWRETAPQRRAVDLQLKNRGLPASIGCTPMFTGAGRGGRTAEVLAWADEQQELAEASGSGSCCWVAIDDMELELPDDHFVQTDPSVGLTAADADRVMEMLRRQQQKALGPEIAELPRRVRRGAMQRSSLGMRSRTWHEDLSEGLEEGGSARGSADVTTPSGSAGRADAAPRPLRYYYTPME